MVPLPRERAALRGSLLDSSDLSTSTRVQFIERSPGISFKTGFGRRRASASLRRWIQQRLHALFEDGEARIVVDDVDPAEHLRDDRVNESVSRVSKLPRVREIVSERLHDCAEGHDVVIEGRDIGSVVFPDTPYKFYIDASPEVRLQRRAAQGERDEITIRDRDDVSRAVSPLVKAKDAHAIDTSHVTVEQVVTEIMMRLEQLGLPISDVQITNRALGE